MKSYERLADRVEYLYHSNLTLAEKAALFTDHIDSLQCDSVY